jgi:hypothetical protein
MGRVPRGFGGGSFGPKLHRNPAKTELRDRDIAVGYALMTVSTKGSGGYQGTIH